MNKRLAVFLDGTWNDPDNNTNVWRTKLMMAPTGPNGIVQLAYYDMGVGTRWYNRIRGGAFAQGLSKNVREAYQWLMEYYEEGDEIFVFGFSRGAYTARSLTGMIAKVGLLSPSAPMSVLQVFERYKRTNEPETRNETRTLYELSFQRGNSHEFPENWSQEEQWLFDYSKRIPIKFIGVWDTVGALGIPFGRIPGISSSTLLHHHPRLSNIFENAYQALAIDEHRKIFKPTLWSHFIPMNPKKKTPILKPPTEGQTVEQRWFVGAHANVGGGYRNNALATVPLEWLQRMAADQGLSFRCKVTLGGDEHLATVVDSYKNFAAGIYRIVTFWRRYIRKIGRPWEKKKKGWIVPVNETIDATVFDRWRQDERYRPRNLKEWAQREGHDLDLVQSDMKVNNSRVD